MVEGVEGFSPWALCEREPKRFTFNSCTRSVGHGCLNTDGHLPHSYFMLLTASLTPLTVSRFGGFAQDRSISALSWSLLLI